jgi:hypothetical protein
MLELTRTSAPLRAAAVLALVLASLLLAACGSSGKSSSGTTSSSANGGSGATSSTAQSTTATQPERLRACLKKLGIEVPDSVSTISDLLAHAPKGVSRAQLVSAVQNCGGIGPGLATTPPRTSAAAYRQAFVNFVSCMRRQGVNLPDPNTSGKGPVIDTKGVDTSSPKYTAAAAKCAPILRKVLALPTLPKH